MAWSAPMTAVAGATFTASQFNQFVRDNLFECPTAKATSDAQFFVSTGPNAVAARQLAQHSVPTSQSTTSTAFTDLATVGPQVTVPTGSRALVMFSCDLNNTATNGASTASVAVTGASSIAASMAWRLVRDGAAAGNVWRMGTSHLFDTLTPGINTFTMKYLVGSGSGTFGSRELIVLPF